MVPGVYNITIQRGGTFHIELTGSDSVGLIPFGSTYTSALMYIQRAWLNAADPMPEEPLFTLSTDDGTITIEDTVITLHLSAAVTRTLPFVSGVYSLKLIATGGAETIEDVLLKGTVTVENGPTP